MKLISRLDLVNQLGLSLEDGSIPKALLKGMVVKLSESQMVHVRSFGNVLVAVDSDAGKRALFEADFERDKAAKVKALLKKMGKKSLADSRGTEHARFLNQFEKAQPHLVELVALIRQQPPP